MMQTRHPFHIVLLALCLINLAAMAWRELGPTLGIEGFLYPDGTPAGGDFINLWSAGRLVLDGRIDDIYRPDAFMAFQLSFVGGPIGHRIWAYPPHSLFLATPFALLSYFAALFAWSVAGLAVLTLGCRRMGMSTMETAIILLSPATILCLYYGQTGNLTGGLLLLALTARPGRDLTAIGAAAILTIKPQMGFLLPFFWLAERRWAALIWTSGAVLIILALTLLWTGPTAWIDYVSRTLAELSMLERHGTGPFMSMIPSIFMALRIITGDGNLAIQLHLLLAIPIIIVVLWRLWRLDDPLRRIALVLAATVIVTPYMHNYDLNLLAVASLLLLRRFGSGQRGELPVALLAGLLLALPQLVVLFNLSGVPLSPLLMLPLLFLT